MAGRFNEGVACFQENYRRPIAKRIVKDAFEKNRGIPLKDLSVFKPDRAGDQDWVVLFYAESLTIIDYLLNEFGVDKFVLFCQNLRDKRDLGKALEYTYNFSNIGELEQSWIKYIISK